MTRVASDKGRIVAIVTDSAVLASGPSQREIALTPVATRVQAALERPSAAEARKQRAADKRARQMARQSQGMR